MSWNDVILLPLEPDAEAQKQVEEATCHSEQSKGITCQVEIHTSDDVWTLFCRNSKGERKSVGGDEIYIRYEEFDPVVENEETEEKMSLVLQAVAIVTDNEDGSYSLSFYTTPTHPSPNKTGSIKCLTVYLEYSNHIGRLPSPQKRDWKNGGYTHKRYNCSPRLRPPVKPFNPPINENSINLNNFERVICFGDSTMDQFVRQRPNKKGKYYFQSNLRVGEKMRLPMNSETFETHLQMLQEQLGEELSSSESDKNTALILGSCLWDILDAQDTLQGKDYQNHITSCRRYIERIRDMYKVTIVWKSPMAVHIHWVDLDRLVEHDRQTATLFGIDRVRYMSASRSKFLYEKQTELMKELQVPVLDLFRATYLSADKLYPSDGRHYRPDLNRLMLQWYYR